MRILSFLSRLALICLCLSFLQGTVLAQEADCTPPTCAGCGSQEGVDACRSGGGGGTPFLFQDHPIKLLQPLDGSSSKELNSEPGINILYTYFNHAWPWVIGSAAGIGVLQALVGGIQIMLSGGKAGKEEGKTRLLWALAGLLMVGLSGLILETLNPLFYTQA